MASMFFISLLTTRITLGTLMIATSCVIPFWCGYCASSNHDVHNCPYHDYVDATCASLGKKINEFTDKMEETMKERIA